MKDKALPVVKEAAALSVPSKKYTYRFFLSICFLVLLAYSLVMGTSSTGIFVLSLLNIMLCADIILKNAFHDLESFRFSTSSLASIAVLACFGYCISKTFLMTPLAGLAPDLYLVLSLTIVLYLWTCLRTVRRKESTKVFIKKLDDFLPKSARLMNGQREMMIFARELKKDDIIKVKAGERIPCEGEIAQGETAIDESLITGNMMPTPKVLASRVYAGTLNKGAQIMVRVSKGLDESVISGIITSIKNSERQRCIRKDEMDNYAPWLLTLWIVVALLGYIYFYWAGDYRRPLHTLGICLLVMGLACPCSLFFCAVWPAWFIRLGALRKKIKLQALGALDVLKQADAVFFDKTGTLTYGELRIQQIFPAQGVEKEELLACLATAEQMVDGPFAGAVNIYAQENKIVPHKIVCFDVLPGLGVKAIAGKDIYWAGRPQWLQEQGVEISCMPQGDQAVICAAKNNRYLGYVLLDDKLRPHAAEMVAALKEMGKEVILMSGDNESSVSSIAGEIGISNFNFGVLPQTKAEILGNFRALGKKVVMVGDGFNDITALLRADAGIVFSSGKNVYNNWVDIILQRSDLAAITDLFVMNAQLSRRVWENVVLSVFCNLILVVVLLVCPIPENLAWSVVPVGFLLGLLVIFLNSVRLLK